MNCIHSHIIYFIRCTLLNLMLNYFIYILVHQLREKEIISIVRLACSMYFAQYYVKLLSSSIEGKKIIHIVRFACSFSKWNYSWP